MVWGLEPGSRLADGVKSIEIPYVLKEELKKKRLKIFINVIYRPDTSHYSHVILPEQFDGHI